ncbi:MAG: YcbK family protein, partial [Gemmatimonadaceae bacterium]
LLTSGYRTPATNARLVAEGAAVNSLHMRGQAADISLRGRTLSQLHTAALSLRGGGVGYYPAHDFIHVDVGPLRTWTGAGGATYASISPPAPIKVGPPSPTTTPTPAASAKPPQVVVVRGGQHPSQSIALRPGAFLMP